MTNGHIAIGIIRTSFGLRGELKVRSLSGEWEHFLTLKEIYLKNKTGNLLHYQVESVRLQKDTILLKLAGINTPEQGRTLSGTEIWVERQWASPKAEDEYYHADLCTCEVYIKQEKLGRIKSVIDGNASELLEVITKQGRVILIPFIDRYVGTVDIEQQKVYLKEEAEQL